MAPYLARGATAFRRRPYVQNVRRSQVTVRWTTEAAGEASVDVSGGGDFRKRYPASSTFFPSSSTGLPHSYYRHEALITGLEPGSDYDYSIRLDGEELLADLDLRFRTAGVQAFTFLAVGDTGVGSAAQAQIAKLMQGERPRLVVHTGDVAYPTGQFEAYENRYFDYYHATMSRVPFYPCPGNHDYYETGARPYLAVHDLPGETVPAEDRGRYYSFDWADVHFVSLDTNETLVQASAGRNGMLQWLDRDLAQTKKFWRVVFFHHPPYAYGPNSTDGLSNLARVRIVPILERYGVPLVLNGHEHSYQRTRSINGVVYVTTGGGGADLYRVDRSNMLAASASRHHYLRSQVSGHDLTIRAIDENGQEFDQTVLRPPPLLARQGVVSAATFEPLIGSGSIVSIFGWQLGLGPVDARGAAIDPAATTLRVTAGGKELPLLLVSPTQVNAVLPRGVSGRTELRLTTPGGSAAASINVVPVAAALFPIVTNAAGDAILAEAPSRAGAVVYLYATGLAGYDGEVSVVLNGIWLAGRLSETGPGLQRIAFELPPMLGAGVHPVSVEAGGGRSNSVPLAVAD